MIEAIEAQEMELSSVARTVKEGGRAKIKIGDQEFALISLEDLEFLEDVENDLDLLEVLKAVREIADNKQLIPWEELLANLKQDRPSDGVD